MLQEDGKDGDAKISHDADGDQFFAGMVLCQTAEEDGKGEGHDLGHQQSQQQAGGVQTQCRAVGGSHVNDGVHTVDVEEEGQQEEEGFLFLAGILQGVPQTGKGRAHRAGTAFHKKLLPIGLDQRQAHAHPPQGGDAEGDEHGSRHAQTQTVGKQHGHQTGHKGQAGADIAPGIAQRGHIVHPLGIGHVGQHGIIKNQTARIAHLGDDKQNQKQQPLLGKAQADAAHGTHRQKGQEDGLFKALVVGHGAEHRAQNGHQQGGDRGRIAPIGQIIHVAQSGGAGQMVEVDGHDGGHQQGKGRVAHVIEHPVFFLFGQTKTHKIPHFLEMLKKLK